MTASTATLTLVDGTGTKEATDKLAANVEVAGFQPSQAVSDKQAEVETVVKPTTRRTRKTAQKTTQVSKPATKTAAAKPAAKKAVAKKTLPHNGKAKAEPKPKVEVTDADRAKLVYVADSQGDKAKTRHLDSCNFFQPKYGNATKFTKVTDAKRLAELKPCRECAHRAAVQRVSK